MITLECILHLLAYVLKKLLKYGKIQMMGGICKLRL